MVIVQFCGYIGLLDLALLGEDCVRGIKEGGRRGIRIGEYRTWEKEEGTRVGLGGGRFKREGMWLLNNARNLRANFFDPN